MLIATNSKPKIEYTPIVLNESERKPLDESSVIDFTNREDIPRHYSYIHAIDKHIKISRYSGWELEDGIYYGIRCKRRMGKKILSQYVYLDIDLKHILNFFNPSDNTVYKLNIRTITDIELNYITLQIGLVENNQINHLTFNRDDDYFSFLYGFYQSVLNVIRDEKLMLIDYGKEDALQLLQEYDVNLDQHLSLVEFERLIKDFKIKLKYSAKETFQIFDVDHSEALSLKEFFEFVQTLNSGIEFLNVFNQYSRGKTFLTFNNVMEFVHKEQKEIITVSEALSVIIAHKREIIKENKKYFQEVINNDIDNPVEALVDAISAFYGKNKELSFTTMSLSEFKRMLINPRHTTVYQINKLNTVVNMHRPLNEYFINSSNNTFLSGHQIFGGTSEHMYAYTLLSGFRMIELDVWDGEYGEPKITHGYCTMGMMLLRDVLVNIKNYAFARNPYPVILNVQNHCEKIEQQMIVVEHLNKYLVDFYVLDKNNLPQFFPSPEELKNKFIICCRTDKIEDKKKLNPNFKKDQANTYSQEITTLDNSNQNFIKDIIVPKQTYDHMDYNEEPSRKSVYIFKPKRKKKTSYSEFLKTHMEEKDFDEVYNNYCKKIKMVLSKPRNNIRAKELELHKIQKLPNQDLITDLKSLVSLTKIKFHFRNQSQNSNTSPWEIAETKAYKIPSADPKIRLNIAKFCKKSFMIVYPDNLKSANVDPTKSWTCGIQFAAINAQSLNDDWTLLNTIFFKINNNTGYILKDSKLRSSVNDESGAIDSQTPVGRVSLNLITSVNLYKLVTGKDIALKDKNFTLRVYLIGSYLDDNNHRYEFKLQNDLLHTPYDNEVSINFKIYEKELSFICIKVLHQKTVVARSVIPIQIMCGGIRHVPLYDQACLEIPEVGLIFRINKTFF